MIESLCLCCGEPHMKNPKSHDDHSDEFALCLDCIAILRVLSGLSDEALDFILFLLKRRRHDGH